MRKANIIINHALNLQNTFSGLPFLASHVGDYASAHHENIDGSGYPFGLVVNSPAVEVCHCRCLQPLTAKDRPHEKQRLYRRLSALWRQWLETITLTKICSSFYQRKIYANCAKRELTPQQQIDV